MSSYWCYRCARFVRVFSENHVVCPHCDSGFVEAVDSAPASPESIPRFPSWGDRSEENQTASVVHRRSRRNRGDRSPFNPVIVLRSPSESGREDGRDGGERSYELYYDDGEGSGLRPLPPTMSDFLMGSGFDRLLDQLAQIEVNGIWRPENPPASKSAIESMPIVQISSTHINSDSHCAVCKEAFVLGSEAREMPCMHIYHPDCILPWLSLRNSCPVCRHELPTETGNPTSEQVNHSRNAEEAIGLTIWRLPGGGFAVGRFSGGRRGAQRELPVVYTEMDGGFNNGVPRRVAWRSRRTRRRDNNHSHHGIARFFSNLASMFRRSRSSSQSTISINPTSPESSISESSISRSRSVSSSSVFSRYLMRRNSRSMVQEGQRGIFRW